MPSHAYAPWQLFDDRQRRQVALRDAPAPRIEVLQRQAGNRSIARLLGPSARSDEVIDGAGREQLLASYGSALAGVLGNRAMGQLLSPAAASSPAVAQRRAAPYIKKVTVHLTPPQSAELEWKGTPPADAPGSDSFTVSTGKGYGDPGDPAGTCKRMCCSDPATQCASPQDRPGKVGSCCTFTGSSFWTGRPQDEHNGWKWWTPIQPHYSSRGIALHGHDEVTGQPIGHGCVRMDYPNAHRIYSYSNRTRTNVTIDGTAAPVKCDDDRKCEGATTGALESQGESGARLASAVEPVAGQEGVLS